eukprot:315697-Pelagomonas_calceolata.AAC.3
MTAYGCTHTGWASSGILAGEGQVESGCAPEVVYPVFLPPLLIALFSAGAIAATLLLSAKSSREVCVFVCVYEANTGHPGQNLCQDGLPYGQRLA